MSKSNEQLTRSLGLPECITLTAGSVIGVGLFTVGSSQVGIMGSSIILATIIAFLLVLWPAAIYGEMGGALPLAGGTYAYAKRAINYPTAVFCSWHYLIAQIGIAGGESLAFASYFGWLLKSVGITYTLDSRIVATLLIIFFVYINYKGIAVAAKWQNAFMYFFWGASLLWFATVLKDIQFQNFVPIIQGIPREFTVFAKCIIMVWWCFAGFETLVGMGSEVKFPQITIPRALKLSPFIVFSVNALFQWFLVGLTPLSSQALLTTATAPFATSMELAGIVGIPLVILCLGITFGGDLSTLNPCIAGPSRYMYVMAEDGCFPKIFAKIHPKYNNPYIAVIAVGIVSVLLIMTGSIVLIAAMCAFSQMICYIIGFISYLMLQKKEPNLERQYKVPFGKFGAYFSIVTYLGLMILAVDRTALPYNIILSIVCIGYYFLYVRKRPIPQESIDMDLITLQTIPPTVQEKAALDKQYKTWRSYSIGIFVFAILIYVIGFVV
ncbi:MAG: APC family permease [Peptostreptococcaceae bacterium]|nr:APC family permease [Peptostreptococcaceae bacterium]